LSPKQFLIPLSYAAVLGGCCTLIGTSTNLLVNDMAVVGGQPRFGIFEITPVGLTVALAGGLYLMMFTHKLVRLDDGASSGSPDAELAPDPGLAGGQIGDPLAFAGKVPLHFG